MACAIRYTATKGTGNKVRAAELLREDRVLRVMVVRNEIPQAFVEWLER
jgi:hypothetical protein